MPHKRRRQGRMLGRLALVVLSVMSFGGDIASAYFVDDAESFNLGVSILRGALGAHARVLRLEVTRAASLSRRKTPIIGRISTDGATGQWFISASFPSSG